MTRDESMMPSIAVAEMKGTLGGMPSDEANRLFIRFLSEVSKDCGNEGAYMIGHNKANFKCGEDMLSISCTTEDGNVRTKFDFSSPVGDYTGVVNVIVYGLDYPVLKRIVESRASEIPGCSVKVIEEGGCDDPECNDPYCNDPDHRRRPITIEGL